MLTRSDSERIEPSAREETDQSGCRACSIESVIAICEDLVALLNEIISASVMYLVLPFGQEQKNL